jgi:L-ascorbate metabolism protein UlaG (beta-lactamase superfamily)
VEITWLGRNCFRLRGREGVVVTDPCPPASGYRIGKLTADIVTLSNHDDPGYSYTQGVNSNPFVLDAPGEYEVGGILVTGVATRRAEEARNVVFVCELDGIRIAHLGLISSVPATTILEEMDDVDVLLIPAGGGNALSAAAAADLMTTVDPRVAIPMNYKTAQEQLELEPLDRFLKETGSKAEPQPRLQMTRNGLPAELTVMVLEPRL